MHNRLLPQVLRNRLRSLGETSHLCPISLYSFTHFLSSPTNNIHVPYKRYIAKSVNDDTRNPNYCQKRHSYSFAWSIPIRYKVYHHQEKRRPMPNQPLMLCKKKSRIPPHIPTYTSDVIKFVHAGKNKKSKKTRSTYLNFSAQDGLPLLLRVVLRAKSTTETKLATIKPVAMTQNHLRCSSNNA